MTVTDEIPAILGGTPISPSLIPIIQPTLPSLDDIQSSLREILETRMITNHKYVKELEAKLISYIGAKNVIALSSCTTGLLLIGKSLGIQEEVITPSFSFSATSLALLWLGCKPIFVDCHPTKFTIDIDKIQEKINSKTSAVLATHIFGNPCDIKSLEEICDDHNLKLIFDAAHGSGAKYRGMSIGNFGDAESFSMSPTKVLTAGEGGYVTVKDNNLAEKIRIGRNYGNPGDYNTSVIGLSGRMPEFNAIIALKSLEMLEENIQKRHNLFKYYKRKLNIFPGISFQEIEEGARSSCKDFAILLNPSKFGLSRDKLYDALNAENIMTKKYFSPAIHQQEVFKIFSNGNNLDVTEKIAENILCLPLYSHMNISLIDTICKAIERIYNFRDKI